MRLASLSLRYKFLGVMITLLTVSIFAYLALAVHLFNDDKKGYIYESNASLANLLASETTTLLHSSTKTMRVIAAAYAQQHQNATERNKALQSMFAADGNLVSLQLYSGSAENTTHKPLIELNEATYLAPYNLTAQYYMDVRVKNATLFAPARERGFYIHNASLPQGAPLLAIAIPFSSQQNNIVDIIAVGYLRQDQLVKMFTTSQMYRTYLIDDRGRIVVHPDRNKVLKAESLTDVPVVRDIIKTKFPTGAREYLARNQQAFILAYSKLDIGGLTVISEIERDKAFLAARKLIEKSVLFALLIVFVAIIVSVLFTKRVTLSLKTLYAATMNIARGDFSIRVPPTSADEIGALANSFNVMTGKITALMQETAEKARLERELDTASMVQSTFFTGEPIVKGPMTVVGQYQPATQCGGDWWGHFSARQGLEYVFVADAMGHGVPAALVTAMAYASCMSTAEIIKNAGGAQSSPRVIIELFNKILFDALRGKISMTFFIAAIDTVNGKLTFANAGHNFPVLVPNDPADDRVTGKRAKDGGANSISLQLKGTPLGLDRAATFEEKTIDMRPGDKLFMFTDGLIECRSPAGAQWGRKTMIKHILQHSGTNALEMKDHIMRDAFGFFNNRPLDDDITVVVIEMDKRWQVRGGGQTATDDGFHAVPTTSVA